MCFRKWDFNTMTLIININVIKWREPVTKCKYCSQDILFAYTHLVYLPIKSRAIIFCHNHVYKPVTRGLGGRILRQWRQRYYTRRHRCRRTSHNEHQTKQAVRAVKQTFNWPCIIIHNRWLNDVCTPPPFC